MACRLILNRLLKAIHLRHCLRVAFSLILFSLLGYVTTVSTSLCFKEPTTGVTLFSFDTQYHINDVYYLFFVGQRLDTRLHIQWPGSCLLLLFVISGKEKNVPTKMSPFVYHGSDSHSTYLGRAPLATVCKGP